MHWGVSTPPLPDERFSEEKRRTRMDEGSRSAGQRKSGSCFLSGEMFTTDTLEETSEAKEVKRGDGLIVEKGFSQLVFSDDSSRAMNCQLGMGDRY